MPNNNRLHEQIDRLYKIMRDLRDPKTGCPWDIEQNFETIAPYTIEEAYEVADAIHTGDRDKIADELGDLLLQVVFHAQIAPFGGNPFEPIKAFIGSGKHDTACHMQADILA